MADFKVSQLPVSTQATPSDFIIINKNNNATHRIGIQDLIDTVPPTPGSSGAPGAGTITISQPGAGDQTFNVNQTGNTTITLMNDDTVVTPGNGALNIRIDGQEDTQTGTYTANQENGSTITIPTISYDGLSNKPSIGEGTITISQPGAGDQTFTVNQTGNTTITLLNDDTDTTYSAGDGLDLSDTTFALDNTVIRTTGNQTKSGNLTANSFIKTGGKSDEFLMADGSVSTGGGGVSVESAAAIYAFHSILGC